MSGVFSSPDQLARIGLILSHYIRLPVSTDSIPGAFLESVLAHVRGGRVLPTKDLIDVYSAAQRVGWSIKSTMAGSPLTWMRATFADRDGRIERALASTKMTQELGNSIIDLINSHALASLERYDLAEIGYARLIVQKAGVVRYFGRRLCTRHEPTIFRPDQFTWSWSTHGRGKAEHKPKALHGHDRESGDRWWSWFPGQNKLHFNGDRYWWPPASSRHAETFRFPAEKEKLSFDWLVERLETL